MDALKWTLLKWMIWGENPLFSETSTCVYNQKMPKKMPARNVDVFYNLTKRPWAHKEHPATTMDRMHTCHWLEHLWNYGQRSAIKASWLNFLMQIWQIQNRPVIASGIQIESIQWWRHAKRSNINRKIHWFQCAPPVSKQSFAVRVLNMGLSRVNMVTWGAPSISTVWRPSALRSSILW